MHNNVSTVDSMPAVHCECLCICRKSACNIGDSDGRDGEDDNLSITPSLNEVTASLH